MTKPRTTEIPYTIPPLELYFLSTFSANATPIVVLSYPRCSQNLARDWSMSTIDKSPSCGGELEVSSLCAV